MFQNSLSGLNAYSQALDTVGHNLANSLNVGFKGFNSHFADMMASASKGFQGDGIGTRPPGQMQNLTQGSITRTDNPLDMAINGNAFFVLGAQRDTAGSDAGGIAYSRNGQFRFEIDSWENSGSDAADRINYIVDGNGSYLMGWNADPATGILPASTNAPEPLKISMASAAGKPTTTLDMLINLDNRESPPEVTPFDPASPSSFNWGTARTVFDSAGVGHELRTYFVKVDQDNWTMHTRLFRNPNDAAADAALYPTGMTPSEAPVTLTFGPTGLLETTAPSPVTFTGTLNGATMSPIQIGLAPTTGTSSFFSAPFSIDSAVQDGYGTGELTGFEVGDDGIIHGKYSNDTTHDLGRVALAKFKNPAGLVPDSNNHWLQSTESGSPSLWPHPDEIAANLDTARGAKEYLTSWGRLEGASVEESNVDLSKEMIDLVIMQRNYQANSQGIKTQDQMLQSLLSIR